MPEEAFSYMGSQREGASCPCATLGLSRQLLAEHHQSEATSSKACPGTLTTIS